MNRYPAVWATADNEQKTSSTNIKIIFFIFKKV